MCWIIWTTTSWCFCFLFFNLEGIRWFPKIRVILFRGSKVSTCTPLNQQVGWFKGGCMFNNNCLLWTIKISDRLLWVVILWSYDSKWSLIVDWKEVDCKNWILNLINYKFCLFGLFVSIIKAKLNLCLKNGNIFNLGRYFQFLASPPPTRFVRVLTIKIIVEIYFILLLSMKKISENCSNQKAQYIYIYCNIFNILSMNIFLWLHVDDFLCPGTFSKTKTFPQCTRYMYILIYIKDSKFLQTAVYIYIYTYVYTLRFQTILYTYTLYTYIHTLRFQTIL